MSFVPRWFIALFLTLFVLVPSRAAVASPGPDQALFRAIEAGDALGAATLLRQGASPNTFSVPQGAKSGGKAGPLHMAALKGNTALVRLLLENGAKVDLPTPGQGSTPLFFAASAEVAALLLDTGASPKARNTKGQMPLHAALKAGREPVARLLVERGAPLNVPDEKGWKPLYAAAVLPTRDLYDLMVQKGAPVDLVGAAMAGDVAGMKALLAGGQDTEAANESGATLLHVVASLGRPEAARLLLERGANPARATGSGNTPLHFSGLVLYPGSRALRDAKPAEVAAVAELLLAKGAPVDAPNKNSETPLTIAACFGPKELVRTLLQHGASPWAANTLGQTALHQAVTCENKSSVYLLLTGGADVDQADLSGDTPLHLAASRHDLAMTSLLLSLGADPAVKNKKGAAAFGFDENATAKDFCGQDALCLKDNAAVNLFLQERPFQQALDTGLLDLVKKIAAGGATPVADVASALSEGARLYAREPSGATALHVAAAAGHLGLVNTLLEAAMLVNVADHAGLRPLHGVKDAATAERLLGAGAQVMAADRQGDTPLHTAARRGLADVAGLLPSRGASALLKNNRGETPADAARAAGYTALADALRPGGEAPSPLGSPGATPVASTPLSAVSPPASTTSAGAPVGALPPPPSAAAEPPVIMLGAAKVVSPAAVVSSGADTPAPAQPKAENLSPSTPALPPAIISPSAPTPPPAPVTPPVLTAPTAEKVLKEYAPPTEASTPATPAPPAAAVSLSPPLPTVATPAPSVSVAAVISVSSSSPPVESPLPIPVTFSDRVILDFKDSPSIEVMLYNWVFLNVQEPLSIPVTLSETVFLNVMASLSGVVPLSGSDTLVRAQPETENASSASAVHRSKPAKTPNVRIKARTPSGGSPTKTLRPPRRRSNGPAPSTREIDVILLEALMERDLKNLRKLLFFGASANAVDENGQPALHLATQSQQVGVIRALAEQGADLNRKSATGDTPLHAAVREGDEKTARLLLELGADPLARNAKGQTPRELANQLGKRPLARFLKLSGG